MNQAIQALRIWLEGTYVHYVMNEFVWSWPISESLHFLGLSLLIGTVGLFDLRLMGIVKRLPVAALHRLVPWGILGYGINVITGLSFLAGAPDQYIYNVAFQFKILFMILTGINVLVFYWMVFPEIAALGAGDEAPLAARIIGGVSLFLWLGIIVCGRLLTFYRPPDISCPWCW